MGKHIRTINENNLSQTLQGRGCGECQASCQSACKTSCTVGNQVCVKEKK
ncbi:MAG TPA: six-cysteine peptide SCIFF [Desulfotomaculum sp.]|nr:six-cysteine peptide SCIFF [Desulfotomaculum sp.]